MTKDQIIAMAERADAEADKRLQCPGEYHPDWHDVRDEIFAQLVAAHAAAAEREACAVVCELNSQRWPDPRKVYVAHECAAAIRERK